MRGSTLVAIILGLLLGLAAGIGGYTFLYAKGASYLTNDPAACANCHVMQSQYDQWRSSPAPACTARVGLSALKKLGNGDRIAVPGLPTVQTASAPPPAAPGGRTGG